MTTRIGSVKGNAQYYGPFFTRVAAEKFANDSLDLFKMRRCVDDLHPDPAFPGCIYSEMKMCLAPCFKGCTDEEYAAEVDRVQQFFQSGGRSLMREIERQRDEASANLDFEGAAAMHARLDKVKAAAAQLPEIVRRLDELNGVMIQPSAEREAVMLFKIVAGQICEPVALNVGKTDRSVSHGAKPQSMESRITDALAAVEAAENPQRAGVDGASGAAEALVLPHHEDWRAISDRQHRRAADATRGARSVARFSRREGRRAISARLPAITGNFARARPASQKTDAARVYNFCMSAKPDSWNSDLYQSSHSFVWQYGRDLLVLLNAKPGERILDVGCGTGQLTSEITQFGAEVVGIDASPDMISTRAKEFSPAALRSRGRDCAERCRRV